MPVKTLKDVTVADAYLQILADRGVEYLFANAGTDFAPLIEALAKAQALGTPHPRPVTCPHENTAQHMAIGYFLATGRMQMTMHHVNVGTANAMKPMPSCATIVSSFVFSSSTMIENSSAPMRFITISRMIWRLSLKSSVEWS